MVFDISTLFRCVGRWLAMVQTVFVFLAFLSWRQALFSPLTWHWSFFWRFSTSSIVVIGLTCLFKIFAMPLGPKPALVDFRLLLVGPLWPELQLCHTGLIFRPGTSYPIRLACTCQWYEKGGRWFGVSPTWFSTSVSLVEALLKRHLWLKLLWCLGLGSFLSKIFAYPPLWIR